MTTIRSLFGRELPNILLTVVMVPIIIFSAITTGGLRSWVTLAFTGGEHMTREGLAAYTSGVEGLGTIHFLNTGSSDAILLESDGHFALIDSSVESLGDYVLDYVKRVAGGQLDFVMGTHNHSDHLGGFKTLIMSPDVTIGRAYLRYSEHGDSLYQTMEAVCRARGIPLLQEDLEHSEFTLGHMKLKIFNGAMHSFVDENAGSMCLLVEIGDLRAFLAADLTWHYGREDCVAKEIGGKLDLLKTGHHGYNGSNGAPYLARLQPKTAVYTNLYENITSEVKTRMTLVSNTTQMATSDFGGIAAVFGTDEIHYYAIGEQEQLDSPG